MKRVLVFDVNETLLDLRALDRAWCLTRSRPCQISSARTWRKSRTPFCGWIVEYGQSRDDVLLCGSRLREVDLAHAEAKRACGIDGEPDRG
jgi:hypothetical protein